MSIQIVMNVKLGLFCNNDQLTFMSSLSLYEFEIDDTGWSLLELPQMMHQNHNNQNLKEIVDNFFFLQFTHLTFIYEKL